MFEFLGFSLSAVLLQSPQSPNKWKLHNFSVMIADVSFKLLHEWCMLFTIIHRPECGLDAGHVGAPGLSLSLFFFLASQCFNMNRVEYDIVWQKNEQFAE